MLEPSCGAKSEYLAVEHAALYLDVAADAEAASVASAADVNAADAVGDMACGVACLADDARCTVGGSADGAADDEVLYRCAVHITERSRPCVVVRVGIVEGQRVAAAVEGAGELVAAAAGHAGDGDVVAELDGLAAKRLAAFEQVAEDVPASGGVYGVGVAVLREVGGVDADGGGDGGVVVVGHGELAAGQCEAGGGEAGYVTRIGGGVEGDSLVGGGVDDAAANPAHSAAEGDAAVGTADGEGYGAGFGLAANCLQGIAIITTIPSAYADVVVIVGRGCRGASCA